MELWPVQITTVHLHHNIVGVGSQGIVMTCQCRNNNIDWTIKSSEKEKKLENKQTEGIWARQTRLAEKLDSSVG